MRVCREEVHRIERIAGHAGHVDGWKVPGGTDPTRKEEIV